jgi:hypothetical protein
VHSTRSWTFGQAIVNIPEIDSDNDAVAAKRTFEKGVLDADTAKGNFVTATTNLRNDLQTIKDKLSSVDGK